MAAVERSVADSTEQPLTAPVEDEGVEDFTFHSFSALDHEIISRSISEIETSVEAVSTIAKVLQQYQEQPELLDPHINDMTVCTNCPVCLFR